MTILDACVEVLKTTDRAMTAKQILEEIQDRQLFAFKAKDLLKVVSGSIRNNLRNGAPPRLREVDKGMYRLAEAKSD